MCTLLPPSSSATAQVWGSGAAPASVHCSAASVGSPALAYVAEEQLVVAALHRRLRAAALAGGGVRLLMPACLEGAELPPYDPVPQLEGGPLVQLTLEGGSVLSTRLLVGADGRDSLVRRCAQIRTTGDASNQAYASPHQQQQHQQQQASPGGQAELLASVTTMHPHNAAFLRFLPTGPLALLPARHGSVVAWTCPTEMAAQLQALPRHELAVAISDALTSTRRHGQHKQNEDGEQGQQQQAPSSQLPLAGMLGSLFGPARASQCMEPPGVTGVVGEGPIVLPLALQHAGRYTRPRLALIGEAAHAVHPLARQGANLGLADAKALSKVIASAVETGQDIGSPALLGWQYAQPQRRANSAATAAMGTLLTLFQPQVGPMAAVRSLGLGLVDSAPALKQTIMRLAMHGLD